MEAFQSQFASTTVRATRTTLSRISRVGVRACMRRCMWARVRASLPRKTHPTELKPMTFARTPASKAVKNQKIKKPKDRIVGAKREEARNGRRPDEGVRYRITKTRGEKRRNNKTIMRLESHKTFLFTYRGEKKLTSEARADKVVNSL